MTLPSPTFNRCILQPLPPAETTASGLFIPQTGRKPTLRGRVLATGQRLTEKGVLVDAEFKAGDEVLYAEYNNFQLLGDGSGAGVLLIDDVIAVCGP